MNTPDDETWIAACAHRLQLHWRTVDPIELEATAREIAQTPSCARWRPAKPHRDGWHPSRLSVGLEQMVIG